MEVKLTAGHTVHYEWLSFGSFFIQMKNRKDVYLQVFSLKKIGDIELREEAFKEKFQLQNTSD